MRPTASVRDPSTVPATVSAWSLSIIGLFNILGSLWIGRHIQTRRMKLSLAGVYLARAVAILIFFFSPKVPLTFFAFAAVIGFTYLSTVPPTNGIVAQIFGVRYLAMLSGFTFLSHQIGSFLGAWLGGLMFDRTGSYNVVWYLAIGLGVVAGLLNLPIDERELKRTVPARAAA